MVTRASLVTASRIVGEQPEVFRAWRHAGIGTLGEIGERVGRDLQLELSEVMLLALVSALNRQNRPLEVSAALASMWMRTIDDMFAGHLGADGQNVYAVEATYRDGRVQRYAADGLGFLQQAMAAAEGAASITVLNLSEVVTRIEAGWLIATKGVEAARDVLLTHIAGASAEEQAAHLAEFDRVAARVAPPTRPGRVTANGTFTLEGSPEPVRMPATSPAKVKA